MDIYQPNLIILEKLQGNLIQPCQFLLEVLVQSKKNLGSIIPRCRFRHHFSRYCVQIDTNQTV